MYKILLRTNTEINANTVMPPCVSYRPVTRLIDLLTHVTFHAETNQRELGWAILRSPKFSLTLFCLEEQELMLGPQPASPNNHKTCCMQGNLAAQDGTVWESSKRGRTVPRQRWRHRWQVMILRSQCFKVLVRDTMTRVFQSAPYTQAAIKNYNRRLYVDESQDSDCKPSKYQDIWVEEISLSNLKLMYLS